MSKARLSDMAMLQRLGCKAQQASFDLQTFARQAKQQEQEEAL